MNVLHVIDSLDTGGAEKIVYYLATRMSNDSFRHRICILEEERETPISKELEAHGIPLHYLDRKPGFDLSVIRKIRSLATEKDIGIVHGHNAGELFGPIAMIGTDIPVLTTIHGDFHHNRKLETLLKTIGVFKKSRKVAVAKYLMDKFGYDCVIYNGIETRDPSRPTAAPDPPIDIPAASTIVGTIGRLTPIKNHLNLLRAAEEIVKKYSQIRFIIVGAGPSQATLREDVSRLGLGSHVLFTGHRSDIISILRLIDIFALPSDEEGLPMAVLEAMAEEVPVVATAVGGVPELVVDQSTGYLVPPKRPDRLAEAICRLVNDVELRKQMGSTARERIEEHFSVDRMIDQYMDYYRTLLA